MKPTQPRTQTREDRVNYRSRDGAVTIITKVATAKRWPQHAYPVVCLQFRPKPGTRVQRMDDGAGIDVLLTHQEVEQHILALKAADPKAGYRTPKVPSKPEERKKRWDDINRRRHEEG